MFKLSRTSKLGTFSWSLAALDTCPGSVNSDGTLVPACSGCYATTGFYQFAPAKAVRANNRDDWQRDDWVINMVDALKKETHFRWFDSGDMYSLSLAEKMYEVMQRTPLTKHWLPTRMAKFAKFADVLARMQALPNVMVRFSSDAIDGTYTKGVHGSVIVPSPDKAGDDVHLCGAYANGGKCGDCRACYDKNIDVIAYPAHGRKIINIIKHGAK